MKLPHVIVGTIAGSLIVLLTGIASAVCPPECPARGGKSKKTDCFAEFKITGVTEATKGFKVACTDSDVDCDTGSTANQCDFEVAVCFNNQDPTLPRCTPEGIREVTNVKIKKQDSTALQAAINAQLGAAADPAMNVCTDPVTSYRQRPHAGNWRLFRRITMSPIAPMPTAAINTASISIADIRTDKLIRAPGRSLS